MKWINLFTILAIIFFAMDARAVTMTFSDFSDTSDLTLNGSTAVATTSDGVVLRLTEAVVSQSGSRPVPVSLQKDIDVPAILGQNDAFIGFTSGTGSDWGDHDILYWEYKDSYDPIDTTDCQEEFQAGYAAGRQSCIDDPASCGLNGNGGQVTLNPDLSFTIPNMVYTSPFGSMNLNVTFSFLDQQNGDLLWKLDTYSIK